MKKYLNILLLFPLGIVLILFLVGLGYQWLSQQNDLKMFPAPGKKYEIDGHLMHLYCVGSGTPTVIIEDGNSSASIYWNDLQSILANTTRVCRYDRPGLGYSEFAPHPTNKESASAELYSLLKKAGIDENLLLLGWSTGGVFVREYYDKFPANVIGMILVDSSHEQQLNRMPKFYETNSSADKSEIYQYLEYYLGVVRARGDAEKYFTNPHFNDETNARITALYNQSHTFQAFINESDVFNVDFGSDIEPRNLDNLPLIVISQGRKPNIENADSPEQLKEFLSEEYKVWQGLQKELANLSTNSKHVIAENSRHMIHIDQPEIIVDEVKLLIESLQK